MERFVVLVASIVCRYGLVSSYNLDVQFPIIYSDPANYYRRSSYFGFSVILQADPHNPDMNWIQVGAPRANYTGNSKVKIKEPGVVFRCPIAQPCWNLPLNFDGLKGDLDDRSTAWVGGAMDIQTPEEGSRSVVCGHRWTLSKKTRGISELKDMLGICYWLQKDFSKNSPLEKINYILALDDDKKRLFDITSRKTAYNWGVGQMGVSVHFPLHTDEQMLLGAPGLLNWQGNAIHCRGGPSVSGGGNQKRSARLDEFEECTIPSMVIRKPDYFAYMGYSVNSGRFFHRNQLVYVSGGPRADSFRGQVLLFTLPTDVYGNNVIEKAVGSMIGEYFGASLAVGDFTGDGLDDLAVGAPNFAKNHDEGCVYVYHGSDKGNLMQGRGNDAKIVGKVQGGRFGSCVASLGDLDQDGFGDLVVGAPYENDNRGAIYIFNGGRDGLDSEYSQRIAAEDFFPSLRGFGISIARPADIDHNLYADVAVGSYISGHAVLLRARPIVTLSHSLNTREVQVERNASKFTLRACSHYTGSNVPTRLVISRTLILDEAFKRAQIRSTEYQVSQQSYTKSLQLLAGIEKCEDVEILIRKGKTNLTDPIEIQIYQEIAKKDPEYGEIIWVNTTTSAHAKDGFCKDCPILSRKSINLENTLVVKFDLECGPDNICESKLLLQCYFPAIRETNTYKLGSNRNMLLLHTDVSNEGELAYSTQVEVLIPAPVNLFRVPTNCQTNANVNNTRVKCDLTNPLAQGTKETLTLELDMSGVKGEAGDLEFSVSVLTQSMDLNAADNTRSLTLYVVSEANLTMAGTSINDTYSYVELHNSTKKTIFFYHVYQVQKVGASPIEEAVIEVSVPISLPDQDKTNTVKFLRMYEPEGKLNNVEVQCSSDFPSLGGVYLEDEVALDISGFSDGISVEVESKETAANLQQGAARRYERAANLKQGAASLERGAARRDKREANLEQGAARLEASAEDLLPANRTLFLRCSEAGMTCARVWCRAGRFIGNAVARLRIRMVLDIAVLEPLMGKKDIIFFSSMGTANIAEDLSGKVTAHARVSTTFLGSVPDKQVNDWVIPLAIGIGLLLLFITIMLLIKVGFFKREKKAELQALINAETAAEGTAPQETQEPQEEVDEEPAEVYEFE